MVELNLITYIIGFNTIGLKHFNEKTDIVNLI